MLHQVDLIIKSDLVVIFNNQMRLRFRNLHEMPTNQLLFSEQSNRSIIVQTYDKQVQDNHHQTASYLKKNIQAQNIQYSSFEKKLKDYKQNLLGLLERSKNQKERYMKRIIDITNQSKSRIASSRQNNYSIISRNYSGAGISYSRANSQNETKPNHLLKPSKAPVLNNSRIDKKQTRQRSGSQLRLKERLKQSRNISKQSRSGRSFSRNSGYNSLTPKDFSETQKLMRKKMQLQEQLRKLNQNLMLRQKIKSKLL